MNITSAQSYAERVANAETSPVAGLARRNLPRQFPAQENAAADVAGTAGAGQDAAETPYRLKRTIPTATGAKELEAFDQFLSFQPLQEFEGYVISVAGETFDATLIDITAGDGFTEEATFPVEDITDDDRPLLKEGAVFRWVIGYQKGRGGQRSRLSRIKFRRLPRWTSKHLVEINTSVEKTLAEFDNFSE